MVCRSTWTLPRLAAAAVAEASKKGFKMAVAVTDTNGDLVYFEKMIRPRSPASRS